jgi:hypothetical protein
MPVTGKSEVIREEGQDKDAYSVSFTNGAKEQLEELKTFLKVTELTDVVKVAIALVQRIKEEREKQNTEGQNAATETSEVRG